MFGISKQLLIALTLGAVAMILNQVYLSTQMEAMDPGKKVQVLLAKKDIRAGSSIVSSMVDRRMIPELYAPKASVRDFKTIEGQEVAVNILAGDYILSNDIADRRLVGMKLSQQIDPKDSSRALTISVDELNSLSRSLTIGDRIDIIFSFNIPGVSQKLSVVLLQNAPIIATGVYSAEEQERGESGSGRKYGAVTLKLSAQDALRLNHARQNGQITVILRSPLDSAPLDMKPITSVLDILSPAERVSLQSIASVERTLPNVDGMEKLREQFKEIIEAQKKQGK